MQIHVPCAKPFFKTTLCSLKLISSTCSSILIDHKFALFGGRDPLSVQSFVNHSLSFFPFWLDLTWGHLTLGRFGLGPI
jgi:hypothetical protein